MNERVFELRKELNLTQENFGNKLGVTKTAISKIEKGENNLSDQMIISICREFDVNEEWLRSGEGEMFVKRDEDEELAFLLGKTMTSDDKRKKHFLKVMMELSDEEWDFIEKIIDKLKKDKP